MNYLRARLQKRANRVAQDYVASIPFDQRLRRQEIESDCPLTYAMVLC